jgi:ketosteroid isomerase-like protein
VNLYWRDENLLVFVEGPRWVTTGYGAVDKGWRDFVDSPISMVECDWVENLRTRTVGDMGYVAGTVELKVKIKEEMKTIRFRGTFVFERTEEGWKIVHEHFSQPAEDPYGIGDWLKQ